LSLAISGAALLGRIITAADAAAYSRDDLIIGEVKERNSLNDELRSCVLRIYICMLASSGVAWWLDIIPVPKVSLIRLKSRTSRYPQWYLAITLVEELTL
jgi:hypothetical protein